MYILDHTLWYLHEHVQTAAMHAVLGVLKHNSTKQRLSVDLPSCMAQVASDAGSREDAVFLLQHSFLSAGGHGGKQALIPCQGGSSMHVTRKVKGDCDDNDSRYSLGDARMAHETPTTPGINGRNTMGDIACCAYPPLSALPRGFALSIYWDSSL